MGLGGRRITQKEKIKLKQLDLKLFDCFFTNVSFTFAICAAYTMTLHITIT
jgi:hypothetical protein